MRTCIGNILLQRLSPETSSKNFFTSAPAAPLPPALYNRGVGKLSRVVRFINIHDLI